MLSDPTRLRIVRALLNSDLCVCELSDGLQVSQSTLSNHLAVLRHTRIVTTQRNGNWIYYHIADASKRMIDLMMNSLANLLDGDPIIAADQKRISERLSMRIEGMCSRSYGQLAHTGRKK